jgi:UDP-glucose 4-epimerase
MKILVTGGAGFIGSNIVDAYLKLGHEVIIIDNLSNGQKKNINPKAKFYKADIYDEKAIRKIFQKEKPDIVNHHAAQRDVGFSVANPLEDTKINILGSVNIIKNCIEFKVKKIIYANSGGATYGNPPRKDFPLKESHPINPVNPYGLNKSLIELYLKMYKREYGLDFVSLRYANVYGPRQKGGEAGVIPIFIEKMLSNQRPSINGDGEQTRDLVYIEDVVMANIIALRKTPGHFYNISTAKPISIRHLFHLIAKETGFKESPIFKEAKPREVRFSSLSCEKAKRELGWIPKTDINEGIKKTVEWFKDKR